MLRLLSLFLVTLSVGCAAPASRTVSLGCDVLAPPTGFVLVTSVSSERSSTPEVGGFFLMERTLCEHGEHLVAPARGSSVEIRGPSGPRSLSVEASGYFNATGVTLADTLVFNADGSPWPVVTYAITVEEAVASYVRDRRARARAR